MSSEEKEVPTPPLWAEFRPDAPSELITGGVVYVDDARAGEIEDVYNFDEDQLREMFVPDDGREHRVRITWKKASGRGALPQLKFTLAPRGQKGRGAAPSASASDVGVESVRMVERMATNTMNMAREMLFTMQATLAEITKTAFAMNERDATRQQGWLEREEVRLRAEREASSAREDRNLALLTTLVSQRDDPSEDEVAELREMLERKLGKGQDFERIVKQAAPLLEMLFDERSKQKAGGSKDAGDVG